jgi:colanic acid biosynthesis glycosyl transferase WcaI
MRIALVCQYFPPESNAPAVRSFEHAREWVRLGHEVTVLTGFPNHPNGVIAEGYRGEWSRTEEMDGIRVVRSWLYPAANRGRTRRVASFLSFCASSMVAGRFQAKRPDVVVGTSPQFFSALSGWGISRMHGVPFVLELRDIWPQVAVEMGAVRGGIAIRALIRLQRAMYAAADRIVIVSEGFRSHLHDAGVPDERITYVPNGIDPEAMAGPGETREALRLRLGLQDRFTVAYIGTHGMAHGLTTVLEAAERSRHDRALHFLFVGDGAEREALQREAAERRLPNVSFLGQQPRETALACYRAADVCLVPLRDLPAFRQVLPSKIFEIMAAGTPVVCSVPGEAGRLVERSGGGLVIPPEDAGALLGAVARLREDAGLREAMGRRGRAFVHAEHLRPRLAERFAGILHDSMAPPAGSLLAQPRSTNGAGQARRPGPMPPMTAERAETR